MLESLTIDINAPYPKYYEAYIHELDKYMISVYFYKNNEIFEVDVSDNYEVTAAVTINDVIITDDVTIFGTSDNKGVRFFINTDDFSLIPGLMKIEFKIKNTTPPVKIISPLCPLNIVVKPSIMESASATLESVGSMAALLKRYSDIMDLLDNPIDTNKIANGAVTNAKIANHAVAFSQFSQGVQDTINGATTDINALKANGSVTTARLANGAVTNDKLADDAVTISKILDGSVTLPKIDSSAYESTPTSGSSKLITSGAVYAALLGKLTFGGSFSTPKTKEQLDSDTLVYNVLYEYVLAADFLYTGSPAMNAYVIQPDANTRLFFTFDEGMYKEEFGTSSWYDCEPCVPASISSRLSALENTVGTLNTQLENVLNGGA